MLLNSPAVSGWGLELAPGKAPLSQTAAAATFHVPFRRFTKSI